MQLGNGFRDKQVKKAMQILAPRLEDGEEALAMFNGGTDAYSEVLVITSLRVLDIHISGGVRNEIPYSGFDRSNPVIKISRARVRTGLSNGSELEWIFRDRNDANADRDLFADLLRTGIAMAAAGRPDENASNEGAESLDTVNELSTTETRGKTNIAGESDPQRDDETGCSGGEQLADPYDSLPDITEKQTERIWLSQGSPHLLDLMNVAELQAVFSPAADRVLAAAKEAGIQLSAYRHTSSEGTIPAIALVYPEGTRDNARMRIFLNQYPAEQFHGLKHESVPGARFHAERTSDPYGGVSYTITGTLMFDKQEVIQEAVDALGDRSGMDPRIIAWELLLNLRERGLELSTDVIMNAAGILAKGDKLEINVI